MINYIYTDNIELAEIEHYAKKMPLNRYSEYQQMRKEQDKINCIIAFLILKRYCDDLQVGELDFTYNSHGKPYLKNNPFYFNISHSKNVVAVGFDTECEIGVDVEKIGEIDTDIVGVLYSNIEKENYKNILTDKDTFYKTWAMKERYAKMVGEGLHFSFNSISLKLDEDTAEINNSQINSFRIGDYYFAIATKDQNVIKNRLELVDIVGGYND